MLWQVRNVARVAALLVLAALVLQIILGIVNVLWLIPLPVAMAHNAGGAVLLLTVVNLNYRLYLLKPVRQRDEMTIINGEAIS